MKFVAFKVRSSTAFLELIWLFYTNPSLCVDFKGRVNSIEQCSVLIVVFSLQTEFVIRFIP
jgi:hypothetical protein